MQVNRSRSIERNRERRRGKLMLRQGYQWVRESRSLRAQMGYEDELLRYVVTIGTWKECLHVERGRCRCKRCVESDGREDCELHFEFDLDLALCLGV